MKAAVKHAALLIFAALKHDCAGAIAEEDATATIGVIDQAAERLGADDQNIAISAGLDELRSNIQRVKKTAARRRDIERGCRRHAQRSRDKTGGRWKDHF